VGGNLKGKGTQKIFSLLADTRRSKTTKPKKKTNSIEIITSVRPGDRVGEHRQSGGQGQKSKNITGHRRHRAPTKGGPVDDTLSLKWYWGTKLAGRGVGLLATGAPYSHYPHGETFCTHRVGRTGALYPTVPSEEIIRHGAVPTRHRCLNVAKGDPTRMQPEKHLA